MCREEPSLLGGIPADAASTPTCLPRTPPGRSGHGPYQTLRMRDPNSRTVIGMRCERCGSVMVDELLVDERAQAPRSVMARKWECFERGCDQVVIEEDPGAGGSVRAPREPGEAATSGR
jgi:hypothetical protein